MGDTTISHLSPVYISNSSMDKLEIDIIESCQRGSRSAQRRLFERYYSRGLNIALRYTKDESDAKEILSNSFFKVFQNISSFNIVYPFYPWFRTIVIHAVSDYYRYHKESYLEIEYVKSFSVQSDIVQKLEYDDLMRLIQHLPHAYRICFNLFVIDGYKHSEIAQMLGIKEGTSKSNVSQAKKKLQLMIESANKLNVAK